LEEKGDGESKTASHFRSSKKEKQLLNKKPKTTKNASSKTQKRRIQIR